MNRSWSLVVGTVLAIGVSAPLAMADVELTITSEPIGATVTAGGQVYGVTPVVFKVPTSKKQRCFSAAAITVTWASGAHSANANGFQVCESAGKKQSFGFSRPSGVPGAELDYQYGVQLQQLDLMRRQMLLSAYLNIQQQSAQQQAQYEAQQRNLQQLLQSMQSRRVQQQSVNCISQIIGNMIYTNCR